MFSGVIEKQHRTVMGSSKIVNFIGEMVHFSKGGRIDKKGGMIYQGKGKDPLRTMVKL